MYCAAAVSSKLAWKDLPLLAKLGVNRIQYAKPDPSVHKRVPDIAKHIHNVTTELFTMDHTMLFRRGNHKSSLDISKSIIEPLELFIEERLTAIEAALPDQEAANLQYEQLNPKALKKFFRTYRVQQACKYCGMGWKKTVCPVEMTSLVCEGCGVDEAFAAEETASNLKKCGKCVEVRYCSKECRISDWKAHKPFCKAAKK